MLDRSDFQNKRIETRIAKLLHWPAQNGEGLQVLRYPPVEILHEVPGQRLWFPVPGMYGGFSYRLESAGVEAKLLSESWCRVVGGSGQRHEITSEGSRLVEEGFV